MKPTEFANWIEEAPAAVTVTDAKGTIVAMNARARETFADDGGAELIGRSVFDCHPEPSLTRTRELYATRIPNHYTIEKEGRWKVIHQLPWYEGGVFAGFVEISIPIPDTLPHLKRG
jgi:PAS domain S-box-containing protein